MSTSEAIPFRPVQAQNRIEIIDILRGFALFGILLVNMGLFYDSFFNQIVSIQLPDNWPDKLARWGILFFAEGKFYSTFAFLFGLGMSIQYMRAKERNSRFVPFYLRRMLALLVFGLVHAYLIWTGDILILYSILGTILLLFFRNCRPKTLLIWFVILLIIPLLFNGALFGLTALSRMTPEGNAIMDQMMSEQTLAYRMQDAQADFAYSTGTFIDVARHRVSEMNFVFFTWPFMGFNVFAMMVLGLYAGKQTYFDQLPGNLSFVRRLWIWALVIGVAGNLAYVIAGEGTMRSVPSLRLLIALTGQTIGAPALSVFYMTSLVLLFYMCPSMQRILGNLAPVGQMSLSNYLLQSITCTSLFYGYGFGMYGKIGPAVGLVLTIAIYGLQIFLSSWWLKHFLFGPMEWLWRTLSYMKAQPMRRGITHTNTI